MISRIAFVAAVGVIACNHARAAEQTLSINFVGDWCYASQEKNVTSYTLPSWTEGGICTKILSIDENGFHGEGRSCDPTNISLKRNTAPSGTAYIATVTASCQADGPIVPGKNSNL